MSDEYVVQKNISRFKDLLRGSIDEVQRRTIERLLVEEEAKLELLAAASEETPEVDAKHPDGSTVQSAVT